MLLQQLLLLLLQQLLLLLPQLPLLPLLLPLTQILLHAIKLILVRLEVLEVLGSRALLLLLLLEELLLLQQLLLQQQGSLPFPELFLLSKPGNLAYRFVRDHPGRGETLPPLMLHLLIQLLLPFVLPHRRLRRLVAELLLLKGGRGRGRGPS